MFHRFCSKGFFLLKITIYFGGGRDDARSEYKNELDN